MTPRTDPVPLRQPLQHENEALDRARLCIRVMDRFCGAVADSPDDAMRAVYIDLFALYLDVVQEELEPYAADLAYALFSDDSVARKRRGEK